MTNLLNLPQIPAGATISISSGADWNDQFFIGVPDFISTPIIVIGNLTSGLFTINGIASTAGLVPGMAVSGFGIPNGTIIAPNGVGANSLTLNNTLTQTVSGLRVTVLPPPLDLTGITFTSMLRTSISTATVLISMSTTNGLMTNGDQAGTFGWSVPAAKLPAIPGLLATGSASLVVGIIATDSTGAIVDLCAQNGPIPVTVNFSVAG
jgi:hypothetical protein